MAIDAVVVGMREFDGELKLTLADRKGGSAGQSMMVVTNPPENWKSSPLRHLVNREIWGCSSQIMLGDVKLADRIGYTSLRLVDGWQEIVSEPGAESKDVDIW